MSIPQWSNEARRSHLVSLFIRSRGFCVYGHQNCAIPEHHYEVFIERLISDWKRDDREQATAVWHAERRAMHSLSEKSLPLRGRFSGVSSTIWHDAQPLYYLETLGMDGLKLKPFALVKIASTYQHLYVDLGDSLRTISKNRKRKAIRYHNRLPESTNAVIERAVIEAVQHYLAH